MKRPLLQRLPFWIALTSMLAVTGLVFKDLGSTAPGPLAKAHQSVSELNGWNSCTQCHGGWFGDMTASCLACHEEIQTQIDATRGLHGNMNTATQKQCALCHSDHHGESFRMINRQSFAQAGFASQADFKHDAIGYAMDGKHLEQDCSKCHQNADVKVLAEGQLRFLGLNKECATCHKDGHEGKMKLACTSCHGQVAFDQLDSMDHGQHLYLSGAHGKISCEECHAKEGLHSLDQLGYGRGPQRRFCQDCHESPHSAPFLSANASSEGMQQKESCELCHSPKEEGFGLDGSKITAEQHARSGFPLDKPHDKQDCRDCHSDEKQDFPQRHPGRKPDDCRSCHRDPHSGQFDQGHPGLSSCLDCHERTQFEPSAFDEKRHAETEFALTGKHLDNKCDACHKPPDTDREATRRFTGTPILCDACHLDSHEGFFAKKLSGRPLPKHGSCELCHDTRGFDAEKDFDHGDWTGFRLEGAHAQESCETCHERKAKPDASGRSFGRISERYGPFKGCLTCHEDPHKGQFDEPGMPKAISGRRDCARCHSSISFRVLSDNFEHRLWTGFALTGAHAKPDCTSCHEDLIEPNKQGLNLGKVAGTGCVDCHESPHGPQFKADACDNCHSPTKSFKALIFDHNLHSRFKLGEQHRDVNCTKCHQPEKIRDRTRVRYRPQKARCVDCHPALVNPFKGRKK